MPLLTVTNLRTSPITIQDPTGLSSVSFAVPGSGAVTDMVITEDALVAIEPQLNAELAAGNLRWSVKDDPSSAADSVLPAAVDLANYSSVPEDFLADVGTTLPKPWAKAVVGSATGDYLADTANGVYSLATAAVSEAEDTQLTWGDQLMIDPTKKPIFEAKVRVNIPGATITADERWVVGLCSAHTAAGDALDAVVSSVWFRGDGANLNIYIEGDDGTHDVNLSDSGVDYADNVYLSLKIDMTDLTKVAMYINGAKVATTLNLSALTAANLLQPIFCYQRDAGTEINLLQIDWTRVTFGR